MFLSPNTLIEPKLEIKQPINNQFPYLDRKEILAGNKFLNINES